jgi:hypothetical protein
MSGHTSSNPPPSGGVAISRTSRPIAALNAASMSASPLWCTDPSGNVISTAGAAARSGSPAQRAENSSSPPQRRGTFALATVPVSTSTRA